MENFICNQHGERFAILNTVNIKICGWITKVEATKNAFFCFFFNICRKFEVLISQGSVATCLGWGGQCHLCFVANFIRFPAVQKFWKWVKVRQSYRQLKGGNVFETRSTYLGLDKLIGEGRWVYNPTKFKIWSNLLFLGDFVTCQIKFVRRHTICIVLYAKFPDGRQGGEGACKIWPLWCVSSYSVDSCDFLFSNICC